MWVFIIVFFYLLDPPPGPHKNRPPRQLPLDHHRVGPSRLPPSAARGRGVGVEPVHKKQISIS